MHYKTQHIYPVHVAIVCNILLLIAINFTVFHNNSLIQPANTSQTTHTPIYTWQTTYNRNYTYDEIYTRQTTYTPKYTHAKLHTRQNIHTPNYTHAKLHTSQTTHAEIYTRQTTHTPNYIQAKLHTPSRQFLKDSTNLKNTGTLKKQRRVTNNSKARSTWQ